MMMMKAAMTTNNDKRESHLKKPILLQYTYTREREKELKRTLFSSTPAVLVPIYFGLVGLRVVMKIPDFEAS